MRIQTIILANALVAFVAGALCASCAFTIGRPELQASFLGIAALSLAVATGWSYLKLRCVKGTLEQFSTLECLRSPSADKSLPKSGVVEFDAVCQQLERLGTESWEAGEADHEELAEVKQLLATIDRTGRYLPG